MVRRWWLIFAVAAPLASCGSLLDIPPEAQFRYTFDFNREGWDSVAEETSLDQVSLKGRSELVQDSVEGRGVLKYKIAFDGPDQVAAVQTLLPGAPNRTTDLRGKTIAAQLKFIGLTRAPSTYLGIVTVFAKSDTPPGFIPLPADDPMERLGRPDGWLSFSSQRPLPADAYAIGIQVKTASDAQSAAGWTTTDLYIDTVEVR